MLFLCNVIISVVLVICLILVAKVFISITNKSFGSLYRVVILLKRITSAGCGAMKPDILVDRKGIDKPTWPAEKKEERCGHKKNSNRIETNELSEENGNIQVFQRGSKRNVIQSQAKNQRERVDVNVNFSKSSKRDVCRNNYGGVVYKQRNKNNEDKTPLVTLSQNATGPLLGQRKWERGVSVRSRNRKRSKRVSGSPAPVSELVIKNDNCRMSKGGTISLAVKRSSRDDECTRGKRDAVDRGISVGKRTPLDVSGGDRFNEPAKVKQGTSDSIKRRVRLWSIDGDSSVNTKTSAQRGQQSSSKKMFEQSENTAVSSRSEETSNSKICSKVQRFSRIVEALAMVMLHVVMGVVWPVWDCIKKDLILFNDIYGEDPGAAYNIDIDAIANIKGQNMEHYLFCQDQCFQCASKQMASNESERVKIADRCKDHKSAVKQKSSAILTNLWKIVYALYFCNKDTIPTLLGRVASALATVKSRLCAAVVFQIRCLSSRATSRHSFPRASAQREKEITADVSVENHAQTAKIEVSQPCSEQPVAFETPSAENRAMKSSRQKTPSQKRCFKKGKKVHFSKSPVIFYTNNPECHQSQTKDTLKKSHAPPLPSSGAVAPPGDKLQAESESKEAGKFTSLLSPSPIYTNAPSQVRESQHVEVSKLVMSPKVIEAAKASSLHITEKAKSTGSSTRQPCDNGKAGSRGKRRYKEEEPAALPRKENNLELTERETALARLPVERVSNQSVSRRVDLTAVQTPIVNRKRKTRHSIDEKSTHELSMANQTPRLTRWANKSNPEQLEAMEMEGYTEVPSFTKPESMVVDDVLSGSPDELREVHYGPQASSNPISGVQVEAMDTIESDQKEVVQNTQQTKSWWNCFPVPWPSFLKSPFTSPGTIEEMEVVQEQGDEEMVVDEQPELIISCAPSEDMDVDPHNLVMAWPLAQPQAMDIDCVSRATPMKVAQHGFDASRPVASPFKELMDTKRPLAPTTGVLVGQEMRPVQEESDEELMIQESWEHAVQPDVKPFEQSPVKRVMPKLLPAKMVYQQKVQPVVQSATKTGLQPSLQVATRSIAQPAIPQRVVQPGPVTSLHTSTVGQGVVDPNDRLLMEKLQLAPSDYFADASDSDEDDDSDDDEVELDLQTVEKFSKLEASPEHTQYIMNLLAEKEHREATEFREVTHSDSDDSDEEEELDPDTMCKLYKLEACVQMFKDYNQKLADLTAAEKSASKQCNI